MLKRQHPGCDENGTLDHNPVQLVLSGDKRDVIDFMEIFNLVRKMTLLQDICIKSKNAF